MKKIIFVILFTSLLSAQSHFTEFINHVNSLGEVTAKQAAVDSFMIYARTMGIPFIEDSTSNFIYLGTSSTVTIAGDFNGWNTSGWSMTRLNQTNFWYRSTKFELDARLDYKFVTNGSNWILDPENPHTCPGGFGPNSELSMPNYIQPWEINYNPSILHGTMLTKTIFSTNVLSVYQLNIYLPPGYDSLSSKTYPTVYFQDGSEYISLGKAVNVIDNLLDSGKIQPVIAVFVKPNNRNEEYAGSLRNKYRAFFVNELVSFIDANYKTQVDAKKRLVLGDSYGGNISALISYNHPEVFGLCGLHSGAFQNNNYEADSLILSGPIKDIKWCSIWGTYEPLYPNMRLIRDSLINRNYEFDWLERPEGHSWGLWRATTDRMLEYFFPTNPLNVSAENKIVKDYILYQNYPNPFNPSTTITFTIPEDASVKLEVYNLLGQKVKQLINNYYKAGTYNIEFNASELSTGTYFYKLTTDKFSEVKKLSLIK